jgi:hypothetical protein
MVELFGGEFGSQILHDRPYKEAIALKDARIKRKLKENEELEKEREKQLKAQEQAMKNRK